MLQNAGNVYYLIVYRFTTDSFKWIVWTNRFVTINEQNFQTVNGKADLFWQIVEDNATCWTNLSQEKTVAHKIFIFLY